MSAAVSTPAVRERPVLFSGAMVRAILAGQKTQTRRLFFSTPSPCAAGPTVYGRGMPKGLAAYEGDISANGLPCSRSIIDGARVEMACPFGTTGDRLWVRESWRPRIAHGCASDTCDCADVNVIYAADATSLFYPESRVDDAWCIPKAAAVGNVPGIFLHRWASRITLEITASRVERLQSITDDDIRAEGVDEVAVEALVGKPVAPGTPLRELWQLGWDAINGEKSPFRFDPFVWVLSFRRLP